MLRKMHKRSSKLSVQLGLLVMVHAALVLCWRELAADAQQRADRARKAGAGAEVAHMHASRPWAPGAHHQTRRRRDHEAASKREHRRAATAERQHTPPVAHVSEPVQLPLWVTEQCVTPTNSTPPLLEALATITAQSNDQVPAGVPHPASPRFLVPNPKPSGWTPTDPFTFHCPALHWFNTPTSLALRREINAFSLSIPPATDFWQDGPLHSRDNAPFLHVEAQQLPTERIVVSGRYAVDVQDGTAKAGVMVRRGATSWAYIGFRVEKRGGADARPVRLESVVTNYGRSDLAVHEALSEAGAQGASLRLVAEGNRIAFQINAFVDEPALQWRTLREASLTDPGEDGDLGILSVGIFAAAPDAEAEVHVGYFSIAHDKIGV
ncbi:hypothetical protein DIPPA_26450 [Diplonema papillatum]|nr:hypothetical protein DIPPA_26450 [Diplonema papillatum]